MGRRLVGDRVQRRWFSYGLTIGFTVHHSSSDLSLVCLIGEYTFSRSTITDYQMIVSNDLINKSFDTGFQLSV